MMAASYGDLHRRAEEGAFVAWIAIIVPAEIFAGFESVVYGVPESHAAMTAGKGAGATQCEKAEARGYSMDLCSYARIDLGTAFDRGRGSPTGGLPAPHLLVSNTNNCSLLAKWFDVHHRAWGVPHFVLDVPFAYGRQTAEDHAYIVSQLRELISRLEALTGERCDLDRVRAAVRRSAEAFAHWKRFLACAEHRPSGITAFDSFVQMAPILTDRGTPQLVEHFRLLADETEARVAAGRVPVPGERYRLLWDNIAPWHQLRAMSQRLAELRANIISASYTYCVGSLEGEYDRYAYDGGDPLEWLARLQNFSVCPAGLDNRHRAMGEAIRRNAIDGVVFASNRSCKVYSVMQMDQLRRVERELGVPCVMIDVDHADPRKYAEAQAFTRIEALLERIEARRG
jgi:benzoyl-CoA reductase/2-hydroxyglutaryl-CoA dehydratase subunit BcrC/BadD/HgdB